MGVVNIIGGGPVGMHCAGLLSQEGFDISVFEEHTTIGRPVQCAGLVSKTGTEELGIKLSDSIVNEIKGARIYSPGSQSITVEKNETVAYVIDRFLFDQRLGKKAKRLGAEIKTNSKLLDIRNDSLFMQSNGHGEMLKSKITVGADGPNSIVRHSVFPGMLEKSFVHAFQVKAEGNYNKSLVEMHFGKFAPGFFAWVIPESSKTARIGTGVSPGNNPADALKQFLQERKPNSRVLSKTSGLIPIAKPEKSLVKGNVLLAGDAAAHAKATTGGGLVFGLKAAEACAATIAANLKHRHSLENYPKNLQPINKELNIHWKIHNHVQNLRPEKFDSLLKKAKEAGIEQFLQEYGDMDSPSRFVRKMLFKPKMWGLLPSALRL